MQNVLAYFISVILLIVAPVARACGYFDDFKPGDAGTVRDPRNGLIWQRCAYGFTFERGACRGIAAEVTFTTALRIAEEAGWRLPTAAEMRDVLGDPARCRRNKVASGEFAVSSAIAHPAYPNGQPGNFWALPDEPLTAGSMIPWFGFAVANTGQDPISERNMVRLVRSPNGTGPTMRLDDSLRAAAAAELEAMAAERAAVEARRRPDCEDPDGNPFFGVCREGRPVNGLAAIRQQAEGKLVPAYSVCWVNSSPTKLIDLLPMLGSGRGGKECVDNADRLPAGVTFTYQRSGMNLEIRSGQGSSGVLNGSGAWAQLTGCGPFGCAGREVQVGWFEQNVKMYDCTTLNACLAEGKAIRERAEEARRRAEAEEATHNRVLVSKDPQAMYLAAGRYAREDQWYRAAPVYEAIIQRFGSSSWAVKASDQLSARKLDSDAARRSSDERSERQNERRLESEKCGDRILRCESSCDSIKNFDSRSSCRQRCQSICSR